MSVCVFVCLCLGISLTAEPIGFSQVPRRFIIILGEDTTTLPREISKKLKLKNKHLKFHKRPLRAQLLVNEIQNKIFFCLPNVFMFSLNSFKNMAKIVFILPELSILESFTRNCGIRRHIPSFGQQDFHSPTITVKIY